MVAVAEKFEEKPETMRALMEVAPLSGWLRFSWVFTVIFKANELAVAVLEKLEVAKLVDNEEEVAGLVEVAQGRRALCRF